MLSAAAEVPLRRADTVAALDALQASVREQPARLESRVFLFQLLCVMGQWSRALAQLEMCGELDAAALPMAQAYREAIRCEIEREAVFDGAKAPGLLDETPSWVGAIVEALGVERRGDLGLAQGLRAQALEAAPATSGMLDGEAFDWIADADSRLGPVLEIISNGRYSWVPFASLSKLTCEPPTDLRDLVWAPVHLWFTDGSDTAALMPARYVGSGAQVDGNLQLSRKTEWLPIGPEQYRGLGQRMLTTSGAEVGLLQVREIVLHALPARA